MVVRRYFRKCAVECIWGVINNSSAGGISLSIRSLARSMIRGATWQNPLVSVVLHMTDPLDFIVRRIKGRSYLPPFSIRVRSAGISQDIGGNGFIEEGRLIAKLLRTHALLTPDSKTLEIGCGCGRTAFALADFLNDGNFAGMDIEPVALESARSNRLLQGKRFSFELLDIRNDLYNPNGEYIATEYVLPYPDQTFDVVFLLSVFTHMLTDEVRNYAMQISRVLKPGGRCFFSAFFLDREMERQFPFSSQQHSFADEAIPGIAVAYNSEFLSSTFAENGMSAFAGPLWGTVHGPLAETTEYQDLMVFRKQG
jgi:SAM-dependent methyltransferase